MSEAIDNIHRDDAVKLICSQMKYSPEKEIVALSDACGRTVFEDIRSRYDVPAVRCSRWDGIVFSMMLIGKLWIGRRTPVTFLPGKRCGLFLFQYGDSCIAGGVRHHGDDRTDEV